MTDKVGISLYGEIFDAWKREKNSEAIQPLPSDFFERATVYLSNLKSSLSTRGEDTSTEQAKKREIEYTEFMLRTLLKTRAKKIVSLSLEDSAQIAPNLLAGETSLIEDLRRDLSNYVQQRMQSPRGEGRTAISIPREEEHTATDVGESSEMMLLRMLQPMPKLVGVDLEEYGPFQQEDIVALPKENALVLIARGAASEVKTVKTQ